MSKKFLTAVLLLLSPLPAVAYSEGYLISCSPSFSSPGCVWQGCTVHWYNWTSGKYGLQLLQVNEPACAHCDSGIYSVLNLEWVGPGRDLDNDKPGSCDTTPLAAHCRGLTGCSWCQWARGQYCPPGSPPCHPVGSDGGPFQGPLDGFSGDDSEASKRQAQRFGGFRHPVVFLINGRILLEEHPVTGHLHLISAPDGSLALTREEAEDLLDKIYRGFYLAEEQVRAVPNGEFRAKLYWTLRKDGRPATSEDLRLAGEAAGADVAQVMPRVVQ